MKYKIIIVISIFLLGLLIWANTGDDYEKKYDGYWLSNYDESSVDEFVKSKDPLGDWVCVNIRDMDYKRAIEVIKHEVGHEMFAEVCEKDIDKCFKVLEDEE